MAKTLLQSITGKWLLSTPKLEIEIRCNFLPTFELKFPTPFGVLPLSRGKFCPVKNEAEGVLIYSLNKTSPYFSLGASCTHCTHRV